MTIAPIPETAADQIAAVIDELLVLLDCETAAIEAFDFDDILAGKERKHHLTQEYQELLRHLAENHRSGAPLPETTHRHMAALDQRLSDAVERNAQALHRAIQANQSLVATIVSAVNRQRAGSVPYQGAMRLGGGGAYAPSSCLGKTFQV